MRHASYLIYPVIIALAVLAGFFIYEQRSQVSTVVEAEPLPEFETLESFAYDSMILGAHDAPITVIEIIDYECPVCQSMHDTIVSL